MSRIGIKPIEVPSGVKIEENGDELKVSGSKGNLSIHILPGISLELKDNKIFVNRKNDSKDLRAKHGLVRSLIANMVQGVLEGYEKKLEIIGVGYRAKVEGKKLILSLGFSHPVEYPFPEGIDIKVEANTQISVFGIDKQVVGQTAADIRAFYPPEPYKGKGIRYAGEFVRRKVGKAIA
ncbi:50S ribosomal protein L6 [Chlamydiota bacterium]